MAGQTAPSSFVRTLSLGTDGSTLSLDDAGPVELYEGDQLNIDVDVGTFPEPYRSSLRVAAVRMFKNTTSAGPGDTRGEFLAAVFDPNGPGRTYEATPGGTIGDPAPGSWEHGSVLCFVTFFEGVYGQTPSVRLQSGESEHEEKYWYAIDLMSQPVDHPPKVWTLDPEMINKSGSRTSAGR
jgi:hypothetical protein